MFPARPLALCHQPASCLVTAIRNQLIGNSKIWSHTIQEIWTLVERWEDRGQRVVVHESAYPFLRGKADIALKQRATTDWETDRKSFVKSGTTLKSPRRWECSNVVTVGEFNARWGESLWRWSMLFYCWGVSFRALSVVLIVNSK